MTRLRAEQVFTGGPRARCGWCRNTEFLALMRAAQVATQTVGLDPNGELVLEVVTLASTEGQPLTVVQVMQQVPGQSATTVHSRLKHLVAQDFIALTADEADNRVKYITPAERALAMFAQRGQMVTQALEALADADKRSLK